MNRAHNFIDLSNKVFGRWSVKRVSARKGSHIYWMCLCVCGREKNVRSASLVSGISTSCGCAQKEGVIERSSTHRLSKTPEYKIWQGMKARCLNPNSPGAKNYSERGIKVCRRWIDSFEDFLQDMGPRPSAIHSIHRKNNDGNYTPKNCEWATPEVQHNATRVNLNITLGGITKTAAQWCKERGLNRSTVYARLRWGVPHQLAFTAGSLQGSGTNKRRTMEKK